METARVTPPADLGIASVVNFRDVGGLPVADGGRVRTGLLYRSTDLSRLDASDWPAFARLGIRRVYDLRTGAERQLMPDALPPGTGYVVVDVLADSAAPGPARLMELLADAEGARATLGDGRAEAFFEDRYREFVTLPSARAGFGRLFRDLADTRYRPVLVHCTTGRDRTGWAAAALLMLLGTPDAIVLEDYLRSNELLAPSTRSALEGFARQGGDPELLRPLTEAREAYLLAAVAEVRSRFGSIEAYFSAGLSVPAETQERLRAAFLER